MTVVYDYVMMLWCPAKHPFCLYYKYNDYFDYHISNLDISLLQFNSIYLSISDALCEHKQDFVIPKNMFLRRDISVSLRIVVTIHCLHKSLIADNFYNLWPTITSLICERIVLLWRMGEWGNMNPMKLASWEHYQGDYEKKTKLGEYIAS